MVPGDDTVALVGFGAGCEEAVLKVFCPLQKRIIYIVVRYCEDFHNVEDMSQSFVGIIIASECFSEQIEDVGSGGCGDKTVDFFSFAHIQDGFGVSVEWFAFQENIENDVRINH